MPLVLLRHLTKIPKELIHRIQWIQMDSNPVDLFYQVCFVSCACPENLCVLLASYFLAMGVQREMLVHVRTSIYLLLVGVLVCTFFS